MFASQLKAIKRIDGRPEPQAAIAERLRRMPADAGIALAARPIGDTAERAQLREQNRPGDRIAARGKRQKMRVGDARVVDAARSAVRDGSYSGPVRERASFASGIREPRHFEARA